MGKLFCMAMAGRNLLECINLDLELSLYFLIWTSKVIQSPSPQPMSRYATHVCYFFCKYLNYMVLWVGTNCDANVCTCTSYYELSQEKRKIIDSFAKTAGTICNWKTMELVIEQVGNIEIYVDHHEAGDYNRGKCTALLHNALHALPWK